MDHRVLTTLTGAAELLADANRWCKGTNARGANGMPVSIRAESACKWCVHGALVKVRGDLDHITDLCEGLLNDCTKQLTPITGYVSLNDHPDTTHKDIMQVIACAVKKAQAAVEATV